MSTDRTEGDPRRGVKFTDKRRVRDDAGDAASGQEAAERPDGGAGREHVEHRRDAAEADRSKADGAKADEYLADLQRLKAEFENYRKRILREQTRAVELASEGLVHRLLEVIDEFELALVAAEREEVSDRLVHGVEMVYAKLLEILKGEGLERIDAQGKPFDPSIHEALLEGEGPEDGEPYVADVLRSGYSLKGRVLRPAGVKVARR